MYRLIKMDFNKYLKTQKKNLKFLFWWVYYTIELKIKLLLKNK